MKIDPKIAPRLQMVMDCNELLDRIPFMQMNRRKVVTEFRDAIQSGDLAKAQELQPDMSAIVVHYNAQHGPTQKPRNTDGGSSWSQGSLL